MGKRDANSWLGGTSTVEFDLQWLSHFVRFLIELVSHPCCFNGILYLDDNITYRRVRLHDCDGMT
ncbi:hypothetical protein L873DRAFT_1820739 [Choiromyces venosus 120613-1]|uniref:Uncharacterized protein n=1 Tax=Choiromyces venosus 120613-1 TaxID=1336337 RepID=A0A3N4IXT4_9PEZI|nr:hypothetical protein L873DRAFT_1820739 [Choiromyces venosus 120613-1]